MKTTVVHRRPDGPLADVGPPVLRPVRPVPVTGRWSTAKLGVVVSVVAAIVAVVLDLATPLPGQAIVVAVMAVAFVVSCRATVRRPPP